MNNPIDFEQLVEDLPLTLALLVGVAFALFVTACCVGRFAKRVWDLPDRIAWHSVATRALLLASAFFGLFVYAILLISDRETFWRGILIAVAQWAVFSAVLFHRTRKGDSSG